MNKSGETQLVEVDTSILTQLSPLGLANLGDVIRIPDGRSLTIRALAAFPDPVLTMGGFVILGECELLIAAPSRTSIPHTIYLPVSELPNLAQRATVIIEGVLSYWAPHLPSMRGAMGELPFRVLDVPGSSDPWVILYRGPEMIVFVPSGQISSDTLQVLRMPHRVDEDGFEVVRHVAIVSPIPTHQPNFEPSNPKESPVLIPNR